jgi:hypothetical protein
MTGIIEIIGGGTAAQIAAKVLGPTAEMYGEDLKELVLRRRANLSRIFSTLEHKYGVDELNQLGEGAVAPRVLRGVLDEGSFVEDDVGAEYFAGVLASSRTADGKDDAGVALIEVMNGLSSAQLRLHYLIYAAGQTTVAGRDEWSPYGEQREWERVAVPLMPLLATLQEMGVDLSSDALGAAMRNLKRAELVGNWRSGPPEALLVEANVQWPSHALVGDMTNFGIELFCAAHGFRNIEDFKRPSTEFRSRFDDRIERVEPIIFSELPPVGA